MTARKGAKPQSGPVKEKQFESLVRAATDAILGVDHQGKITIWNKAATKMFGHSAKEAIGMDMHALLVPGRMQAKARKGFKDFVKTGKGPLVGKTTECVALRKDSSEFPVDLSISGFRQDGHWHAIGIIRDVTERKRLAETLQAREKQLEITLQSIGDAVISTDMQGQVELMNPVAEELTDWKSSEACGHLLDDVFHIINEESRKKVENPVKKVLREGVVIGLANHSLLISKGGKEISIADSGAPIRNDQGEITGVVLVFRDQTEERKAQRAVAEARAYAESIVDTVHEPLIVLDPDLRVVTASRSFYRAFEVSPEEIENSVIFNLGNRQWNIPKLRKLLKDILPQNTSFDDYEIEHDFSSIGRRTMRLNARRIYREANKTQLILLAIEDITERKKAEAALRSEEQRGREIIETTRDAFVSMDADGVIVDWNSQAETIFGWSRKEVVGRLMAETIIPEKSRKAHEKGLKHYLATGEGPILNQQIEITAQHHDGHAIPVELSIVSVHSDDTISFNAFIRDISGRVRAREALERSREQLRTSLIGTIVAVSRAIGARDPYTAGHQQRVSQLSRSIAQEMDLDAEQIDGLRMGASIHDIGKIYLPAEVLSKPAKLTDIEYELVKTHSQVGYDILKDIEFPWPVADITYQHHERLDGTGYPQGLKGDEICLEARIVAVADVVEAMSSHRPYRPSLGLDAALEEIETHRGTWFDPAAVDACLKLFREKDFSFS